MVLQPRHQGRPARPDRAPPLCVWSLRPRGALALRPHAEPADEERLDRLPTSLGDLAQDRGPKPSADDPSSPLAAPARPSGDAAPNRPPRSPPLAAEPPQHGSRRSSTPTRRARAPQRPPPPPEAPRAPAGANAASCGPLSAFPGPSSTP